MKTTILALLALALTVPATDDDEPAPARPRPKAARAPAPKPPPCPVRPQRRVARPPARTMPELFSRMGEQFMANPALGFQGFLGELAQLEGPALEGVSLTAAEERQAGRKAREEYLRRAAERGYPVARDPRKLAYLRELVDGLARHMTHRRRYPQIDVTLIDAPIPEGQSFPGGYLVFTTALLDEPDEATVAGVVAHELAHMDSGHLYEYARRGKLAEATYGRPPGFGAQGFDQFFTRQMALFGLLMNPYRPEHEHEADCLATTWLYLDGYDPVALVGFFERLNRRLRDAPDTPFTFGRSHPYSLERGQHVRTRLAQLRRWRPGADLGRYPDYLRALSSRYAAPAGDPEPK